ncbi:MAG TPA: ribosome biogenesis GTPase Der [Magnetospirillaceae bacterium]
MTFTVAIVGRPNVGKSTLFNRLVGRGVALVHDRPGVTRDRREGQGSIADLEFTVVDTAGVEDAAPDTLQGRMRAQTELAVKAADVILFLVDARAGITPDDEAFARHLRKSSRPVILLANKCEGKAAEAGLLEAYRLGLGDPQAFSAAHGQGLDALYEALLPFAPKAEAAEDDYGDDDEIIVPEGEGENAASAEDEAEAGKPIRIAIVGRPNVGKSTLVNRLLGEERMLTGPEAGITRDAIASSWDHRGQPMVLVDTAGLRRKARISDAVEKLAASDTIDAIRMANVVILVLAADAILDKQDLAVADLTLEEGRALVIAINKWDAVENRGAALQRLNDRLEAALAQAKGVPTVTMSALEGTGTEKLMKAVRKAYEAWNRRIPTSALNRWLEEAVSRNPPPVAKGGTRIKLRYGTQVKARPPTFAFFSQRADALPESYARYLVNSLREAFDLPGVPIRIGLRKRDNPYDDK